jgi:hypothetical protein
MKKIIIGIVLALLIVQGAEALIATGYTHANDYYQVSYDGKGDAVVRARLVLQNTGQEELTELAFEFPSRQVVFYDVFIETKADKSCLRYKTEPVCVQYDSYYNCLEYSEQEVCDYWSTGPGFSRIEELKETRTSDATVLIMGLSSPIKQGDSAALTIVYKLPGNAQKMAGLYRFDFKTIVDPSARLVERVRVAVNVDSGLYLKGTTSKVNYQEDYFDVLEAQELSSKLQANPAYYSEFSRSIVNSGQFVRTASNLDPWESLSVRGRYATSYFRAHMGSILGLGILGLGILFGIVFGAVRLAKHLGKPKASTSGLIIGVSAAQAVVLSLLWALAAFLLTLIREWFYYPIQTSFVFAVGTLFALLYLAVFFGPPIVLGLRKGIVAGLITPALTLAWLLVITFIAIMFRLIAGAVVLPIRGI